MENSLAKNYNSWLKADDGTNKDQSRGAIKNNLNEIFNGNTRIDERTLEITLKCLEMYKYN